MLDPGSSGCATHSPPPAGVTWRRRERPWRGNPSNRLLGAWAPRSVEAVTGPANEALSTHRLWARTRLRAIRVAIDGACLTDAIHNGSQAVVINIARSLARRRPDSEVSLAVPAPYRAFAEQCVADAGVRIVERRSGDEHFDVVYRPYQLLDPHEVPWLVEVADRWVIGQLDMIAFSNPTYHPPAHFHAVRNLQRWTMRHADAVTFISEFGLDTAFAECPDVDPSRMFVVSCGADPDRPDSAGPGRAHGCITRLDVHFIVCVSATFSHKNRQHAIATFGELCRRTGYEGSLVMAGPEPYYGRSTEADERVLRSLEPAVRDRVVHVGQVDDGTKWWLLQNADLVLYPSVVEGFGLVPFEAAAVGTPSLSHAGSAIVEVLGDGAATVRSWNPVEWSIAAERVLSSASAAADVVEAVSVRSGETHLGPHRRSDLGSHRHGGGAAALVDHGRRGEHRQPDRRRPGEPGGRSPHGALRQSAGQLCPASSVVTPHRCDVIVAETTQRLVSTLRSGVPSGLAGV